MCVGRVEYMCGIGVRLNMSVGGVGNEWCLEMGAKFGRFVGCTVL